MIRPIRPDDLPEMIELCALHAVYEGATYRDDGQAARLAEALFGPDPRLFGWVAEAPGGGLAGYMTATVTFATWSAKPFIDMDCLYLREDARGGGVGRKLMDALKAFARERGIVEIQWQTPPDNALGIGFYRRIGAVSKPKLRFVLTTPLDETAS